MTAMDKLILRVKRGDTRFTRIVGGVIRGVMRPSTPRIPSFLKPFLRGMYEAHFGIIVLCRTVLNLFYRHPLFQARCKEIGRNVVIDQLPFITGHVEVSIGNNVWIGGRVNIMCGRFVENPRFVMKDKAEIGWNVNIVCNREVIIEEHARVSFDCRISDSDGHPRQADLRAQDAPVDPKDIRPVRIGRYAWIGNGSHIMKGVTIGEGAIIGANSVVISDIPAYALALGNPAEVYMRNYGKPSKRTVPPAADGTA
jgi:acetyltransferase-like isoleucine patch superfamily enzyme